MIRRLRTAFVIARRDFTATVLSKTFIFFLLGPLFPLILGGVFGAIGADVASRTTASVPTVAVLASHADAARYAIARDKLATALGEGRVAKLIHVPPGQGRFSDPAYLLAQARPAYRAVIDGPPEHPRLTGALKPDDPLVGQMRVMATIAASPAMHEVPLRLSRAAGPDGHDERDRMLTAQIGQMLVFFLTILLSGMLLSQLVEEKSNKIIEIIAAAAPIDSLFIGKLIAMLAASLVGIAVWVGAGALIIDSLKTGGVSSLPPPAVGWPMFLVLGALYFAMNYLLLGSVFLTIGAQASTVREVQTMSMPVTFFQVLVFGVAASALGAPDSLQATGAAIFPLSSPLVMIARAAEVPGLGAHALALAWQALWVGVILHLGARLFRRTVLKSGPAKPWWKRRAA